MESKTPIGSDSPALQSIDFDKYRSDELVEHLGKLLSLPGTLATLLKWSVLSLLVTWVVLSALFYDAHWAVVVGVFIYGTLAGTVVGVTLGVAKIISDGLSHAGEVLDVLLDTCVAVVDDIDEIESGDVATPTEAELVRGVVDVVFIPAIEAVLVGQTFLVGRLMAGIYKRLLRRAVDFLLGRAEHSSAEVGEDGLRDVSRWAQTVRRDLERLHGSVDRAAGRPARLVIIFVGLSFLALLLVASLPLAFAAYQAGQVDPDPPTVTGKFTSDTPVELATHSTPLCVVSLDGFARSRKLDYDERPDAVFFADGIRFETADRVVAIEVAPEVAEDGLGESFAEQWTDAGRWRNGAYRHSDRREPETGRELLPREIRDRLPEEPFRCFEESPNDCDVSYHAEVDFAGIPCDSSVTVHGELVDDAVVLKNAPMTAGMWLFWGTLYSGFFAFFCFTASTIAFIWVLTIVAISIIFSISFSANDGEW